ncbi:MAG: hypothetical protein PWP40_313 [Rhodocyclaceae bacterium]|nr:hypothetical protein [Rhodocyclaceae bacterium]
MLITTPDVRTAGELAITRDLPARPDWSHSGAGGGLQAALHVQVRPLGAGRRTLLS